MVRSLGHDSPAGTIFNTIILWRVPALPSQPAAGAQPSPSLLTGHSTAAASHAAATACANRQVSILERCKAIEAHLGLSASTTYEARINEAAARGREYTWERAKLHGTYLSSAHAASHMHVTGVDLLTPLSDPKHQATCTQPATGSSAEPSAYFEAQPVARLEGHEGAVFGVRWADGGAQLLSVADDRSARVWDLSHIGCAGHTLTTTSAPSPTVATAISGSTATCSTTMSGGTSDPAVQQSPAIITPAATLWGHTARVWEGVLLGDLAVTGSEDCTTKIWAWKEGKCLRSLHGHKGRGVWHVEWVPGRQMVVTGGADASVKAWWLPAWLPEGWQQVGSQQWQLAQHSAADRPPSCLHETCSNSAPSAAAAATPVAPQSSSATTHVALPIQFAQPPSSNRSDSKGEWVRCVTWGGAPSPGHTLPPLYIGTNAGYVLHCCMGRATTQPSDNNSGPSASISGSSSSSPVSARWSVVHRCEMGGPFSCAAVDQDGERVLLGHQKGLAVVVYVGTGSSNATAGATTSSAVLPSCPTTAPITSSGVETQPSITWQASDQGVVSVFWVPNLGPHVVATSDAAARVRLWLLPPSPPPPATDRLTAPSSSFSAVAACPPPLLLAEAKSHLGECLTCLAASTSAGLLICGDYKGCLLAWDLPDQWLEQVSAVQGQQAQGGGASPACFEPLHLQLVQLIKGVHGRTPMRLLHLQDATPSNATSPVQATSSCLITTGAQDSVLARFECFPAAAAGDGAAANTAAASATYGSNIPAATSPSDSAAQRKSPDSAATPRSRIQACGMDRLDGLTTPIHITLSGPAASSSSSSSSQTPGATGAVATAWQPAVDQRPVAGGTASCAAGSLIAGFKSTQFMVRAGSQQDEVLRLECGGYRRPHAFTSASTGSFAFAHCSLTDHVLHVSASGGATWGCSQQPKGSSYGQACNGVLDGDAAERTPQQQQGTAAASGAGAPTAAMAAPVPAAQPPPCRTLHLVHHGREAHSIRCIPSPVSSLSADGPNSAASPAPALPQQLCFLTASEDGTVRRVLYDRPAAGMSSQGELPGPLVFSEANEVGDSGLGTAMRCLSSWPLDAGPHGTNLGPGTSHLVVAGGAKEVLLAWLLHWRPDGSAAGPAAGTQLPVAHAPGAHWVLQQQWLCMQAPKQGTRPQAGAAAAAGINKRYMDIQVLGPERDHVAVSDVSQGHTKDAHQCGLSSRQLMVAASSDASLSLLALDVPNKQWHTLSRLEHHTHPVLSLAAVSCEAAAAAHAVGPSSRGVRGSILASGATDGCIALWHIASSTSAGGMTLPADSDTLLPSWPAAVQPLLVIPDMHQSGVNALDMGWVSVPGGPPILCCVSAGDDQSLVVMQLQLSVASHGTGPSVKAGQTQSNLVNDSCGHDPAQRDKVVNSQQPKLELLSAVRVSNAHTSALRSVALCAPHGIVLSTGLDQRLRVWRLGFSHAAGQQASSAGGQDHSRGNGSASTGGTLLPHAVITSLRHEACVTLDVLEPASLSWSERPRGAAGGDSGLSVGVAGRGIQVVEVQLAAV